MDYPSEWKEYIGISKTTITNGETTEIEVFLPEFMPAHSGEVPVEHGSIKVKIEDILREANYEGSVILTKVVKATYMGRDNFTVPCIHEGELLRIYNYGGSYEFYWMPMGRNNGNRRNERMRWFVADEKKTLKEDGSGEVKELNDDNTYFIEMNTNDGLKRIHIATTRSDGELFSYDILINCVEYVLSISDSDGNYMMIDTPNTIIRLQNRLLSIVELDKEVINIIAPEQINVFTKRIVTQATESRTTNIGDKGDTTTVIGPVMLVGKQTLTVDIAANITVTSGANYSLTATGNYTLTAAKLSYNGEHSFLGKNFTVATEHGTVPDAGINANKW